MRAHVVGGRALVVAALLATLALLALPAHAGAEPAPGAGAKRKGFRLFARATGALTINRVSCGLASSGNICTDSTGSAVSGGGFWPKGTADQYVFNSGLQLAGIIGNDGGPWAGDTAGGFLFDPKGTTVHGEEVRPIFNAANSVDLGTWPAAGCVPRGDDEARLFHPLLQSDSTTGPDGAGTGVAYCRRSASQGDIWFLSWEGNSSVRVGRQHPLGIAVETRGMGWNFPSGNEDILYFIYTFYNVTSTNRADYNGIRAPLADILYQKALDFHAGAASLGANLPAGGYTINPLFAGFGADMDVSTAGANYSSVNLPFALGYVYDRSFEGAQGWTFDPSIFSAPFFPGSGFVGVKYLSSPTGAGEIQLFSNTINGRPFAGAVNDPRDVVQLYRYLSGTLSVNLGDDPCNTGNPAQTHICFVNNTSPQDMRFFQSSTPLSLAPGQGGSIVVAYIFAAPVASGGCSGSCDVKPGNPLRLVNATQLAQGANLVDSLAGFAGYRDNGDGVVTQDEFRVVPGSLLGKAKVAQGVFDAKFLLPFAPENPDFFLIPGDNQVTVIWRPSNTEQSGDPFFALSSQARTTDSDGNIVNNVLYNPNYRQFDVEGYRVYRGRVDAPNELTLLAQFDYAGTTIRDYTGTVNPGVNCAPELSVTTGCAGLQPNNRNGTTLTTFIEHDLVGDVIQVRAGPERVKLDNGRVLATVADTAVTGLGRSGSCGPKSSCPALANTGVPFVYVDRTPRNNFRYFYSVVAFDVNAVESGPSSLESPRNTRQVTPVHAASNLVAEGSLSQGTSGRGLRLDSLNVPEPTIDPASGRFSGPFPAANGGAMNFAGEFVSRLFANPGTITARLLRIDLGDARNGVPVTYTFLVRAQSGDTATVAVPVQQNIDGTDTPGTSPPATFATADSALSSTYSIPKGVSLSGTVTATLPSYQSVIAWGRGCSDGAITVPDNSTCLYNNPRWFDGDNETRADPAAGNAGTTTTSLNNAGALTGVTTINTPHSYLSADPDWRIIEATLGGAARAADFKVWWGTAGKIDSVIDLTHHVPVPFDRTVLGGGFGLLTVAGTGAAGSPDGRPGVVSVGDFSCVEPFRSGGPSGAWQGLLPCTSAAPFTLTDSVVLGPVAIHTGPSTNLATATARPNGFVMYLAGHLFSFQMAGATPPASTTWTLRSYAGTVFGGKGAGGDFGPYRFEPTAVRPFTAVGADLVLSFNARNAVRAPRFADLKRVHTVPDPYYVTNEYEQTTDIKVIKFVNLPDRAIIRIYSASGVLVNILENPGPGCSNGSVNPNGSVTAVNANGGECTWNVRNRNNQVVASGVYFYHIESNSMGGTARRVGRMTIVNFAQ
ncbi:MAG: hypothetical protein U0133_02650 [Gemmatimonadales bacterium]